MTGDPAALSVLLIEDDDVAAEAVMRGLRKHGNDYPLVFAEDGMVGLQILRNTHPTRQIARPYVVLLDLNMPRMSGIEFLQELRADDNLRKTVVFMLTTSGTDVDRARAYRHCIAGYMVKSAVGPQFRGLARFLEAYHSAVVLP
jgi:CheY-like chemotaxis protein